MWLRYSKPFCSYELINANFGPFSRFFVPRRSQTFFFNSIFGEYFFPPITHLDPKFRANPKNIRVKWNTLVYIYIYTSLRLHRTRRHDALTPLLPWMNRPVQHSALPLICVQKQPILIGQMRFREVATQDVELVYSCSYFLSIQ
jgi:hypothetical protein